MARSENSSARAKPDLSSVATGSSGRGRPPGRKPGTAKKSAVVKKAAVAKKTVVAKKAAAPKKRVMSPEAIKRIADAQKKRWAAQKNSTTTA
jgi:hypothetical protein